MMGPSVGLWGLAFIAFVVIVSQAETAVADWAIIFYGLGSLFSFLAGLKLDAKRRG